jgi:predicted nucleic acid-binding protein
MGYFLSRPLALAVLLARGHRLTAYDAAHIEVAMRLSLPLATGGRKLQAAAERAGVAVLGGAQ